MQVPRGLPNALTEIQASDRALVFGPETRQKQGREPNYHAPIRRIVVVSTSYGGLEAVQHLARCLMGSCHSSCFWAGALAGSGGQFRSD
jgi:chemotaxis response regulator CheB